MPKEAFPGVWTLPGEAASTCPAGCQGEAGAQLTSRAPMPTLTLSFSAPSRHCPPDSSLTAAGWVLAEKPGQTGYHCFHGLRSRPALRPACDSRDLQGPLLTLLVSLPRPMPLLWACSGVIYAFWITVVIVIIPTLLLPGTQAASLSNISFFIIPSYNPEHLNPFYFRSLES